MDKNLPNPILEENLCDEGRGLKNANCSLDLDSLPSVIITEEIYILSQFP